MVDNSAQTMSSQCEPWFETSHFGDTKTSDDMVEEKARHCFTFGIECGHSLGPLGEIINGHNNVFFIVGQGWVDCHKVNFPLIKGNHSDDRVQRQGRGSHPFSKNLAILTMLRCLDAIRKQSRS